MSSSYVPQLYKDFVKAAEMLGRKHSLSNVFNDLLTLSICSYHETNIKTGFRQKDEANEELYIQVFNKYDKEEISELAKMMATLQKNAYQAPYSDLLGQFFTEHITNGHNGQFFTPDGITQLMAEMQGEAGSIERKRVADPACGSGRLLLSFAEKNPNNTFYAADNAGTCAKMAAVNFFLGGMKGEVAWMNTLTMEWYGGWHVNRWPRIGIVPIEKEQSAMWLDPKSVQHRPPPPQDQEDKTKGDDLQLTKF